MTQNNAAQPGLTDDQIEALAKKHIAPHADRLEAIMTNPVPYQQTEQFRRVKALIVDVLSKLRAEGVQAGDERAAFEEWCRGKYALGSLAADNRWEAWQARAALASAPGHNPSPVDTSPGHSAPVAEPYDSEKRCRAYYDSDLRPFAADGLTYNVWQAVWHAAQFDRAMTPDSSKPRQHSAPVAGEAKPMGYLQPERRLAGFEMLRDFITVEDFGGDVSAMTAWAKSSNAIPLYAAPQASEAVRLDSPAQVGNVRFGKGVQWSTVIAAAQRHHAFMNTPEKEAARIAKAKTFVESIQVDESPNLQGSPVDRSADLQGSDDAAIPASGDVPAFAQFRMTPWGMMVRAGRSVINTTLMEMSTALDMRPSELSAYECDRKAPSDDVVMAVMDYFNHRGLCIPATAWRKAIRAALSAQPGAQKYWLCCGSKDPNHPNRRAPDCFNATRAKWGTADQHSAAQKPHPKQHNDGGADA